MRTSVAGDQGLSHLEFEDGVVEMNELETGGRITSYSTPSDQIISLLR